jgi:hypothetical protein
MSRAMNKNPVDTLEVTIGRFEKLPNGTSTQLVRHLYRGREAKRIVHNMTAIIARRDGLTLPYKVDQKTWQTWSDMERPHQYYYGVMANQCITLLPDGELQVSPPECGCKH